MRRSMRVCAIVMAGAVVCAAADANAQAKRKIIFIQNIQAKGVPANVAEVVTGTIKTTIIEQRGGQYLITGNDDVKARLGHEAYRQSLGCTDQSCMLEIAEQSRANELIYGKVSRNGQQYRLSLTSYVTGIDGSRPHVKAMATKDCFENQLDWYAKEGALKLLNPGYRMKAPDLGDLGAAGVSIGVLRVQKVKGLDISVMRFSTKDRFINAILPDIKSRVREGDELYEKGKYADAVSVYKGVLFKMGSDIPSHKVNSEVRSLQKKIGTRVKEAVYMNMVAAVRRVDARAGAEGERDENTLRGFVLEYRGLVETLDSIENADRSPRLAPLRTQVLSRKDSVVEAIVSLYSAKGDAAYRDSRFGDAIQCYRTAQGESEALRDARTKRKSQAGLERKIAIAKRTGTNYLTARSRYLIDSALTEKWRNNADGCGNCMDRARAMILEQKQFLTDGLRKEYNEVALTTGAELLKTEQELARELELEEQNKRAEERRKKERKKIEGLSNRFFFDYVFCDYSLNSPGDRKYLYDNTNGLDLKGITAGYNFLVLNRYSRIGAQATMMFMIDYDEQFDETVNYDGKDYDAYDAGAFFTEFQCNFLLSGAAGYKAGSGDRKALNLLTGFYLSPLASLGVGFGHYKLSVENDISYDDVDLISTDSFYIYGAVGLQVKLSLVQGYVSYRKTLLTSDQKFEGIMLGFGTAY